MEEIEELRKLDLSKLLQKLEEAKKELFKIKFEVETNESKSIHSIRNYKKFIAQIKTIIKENELTKKQ